LAKPLGVESSHPDASPVILLEMQDRGETGKQGAAGMMQRIVIRAEWDPEARVWVAESDDLPLVTEAATIEALAAKLPGMIQDLMEDDVSQKRRSLAFPLDSNIKSRHAADGVLKLVGLQKAF
jgi:Domain of unknown function (DUF1902)